MVTFTYGGRPAGICPTVLGWTERMYVKCRPPPLLPKIIISNFGIYKYLKARNWRKKGFQDY